MASFHRANRANIDHPPFSKTKITQLECNSKPQRPPKYTLTGGQRIEISFNTCKRKTSIQSVKYVWNI